MLIVLMLAITIVALPLVCARQYGFAPAMVVMMAGLLFGGVVVHGYVQRAQQQVQFEQQQECAALGLTCAH